MGNISERVAKQILPAELQKNYGNEFGIEVWRVLNIVEKNDTAIKGLLDVLDRLEQPHRNACVFRELPKPSTSVEAATALLCYLWFFSRKHRKFQSNGEIKRCSTLYIED